MADAEAALRAITAQTIQEQATDEKSRIWLRSGTFTTLCRPYENGSWWVFVKACSLDQLCGSTPWITAEVARKSHCHTTRSCPPSPVGHSENALRVVRLHRLVVRVRCAAVPAWKAIEQGEPEFAGRVRRLFDAGRHKTIATLRADGSPRISGIECEFTDSDLRFGSMTGARKGADLKRDPRFALHSPTFHPGEGKENDWPGEAKIAGRAIPTGSVTTDEASEQPDGEMFIANITEVVITGLNADATRLVVESWTAERGLRRLERD